MPASLAPELLRRLVSSAAQQSSSAEAALRRLLSSVSLSMSRARDLTSISSYCAGVCVSGSASTLMGTFSPKAKSLGVANEQPRLH